MPQVPVALRRERAARLRAAGADRLRGFLDSRIGATARVLVENDRSGRCEHYAAVRLDGDAPAGEVVTARIEARTGERLDGRIAA
jgi:threonylcarbamoyladenosine tRNA methylthiotransferase MtaB